VRSPEVAAFVKFVAVSVKVTFGILAPVCVTADRTTPVAAVMLVGVASPVCIFVTPPDDSDAAEIASFAIDVTAMPAAAVMLVGVARPVCILVTPAADSDSALIASVAIEVTAMPAAEVMFVGVASVAICASRFAEVMPNAALVAEADSPAPPDKAFEST